MRPFTRLLLLLLIAAGGFPAASRAQIVAGDCALGTAAQDLDINNVRARLYNKGNLFFDGGDPNYEVPIGSGLTSIFAGGIWIGGTVGGQIRTAAATYAQGGENYEFYPGPLNEDGTLPNPNDCTQYDKMWKVSRIDIASYFATGSAAPDLASWPTGLGAPTCQDLNGDQRCAPSEPAVEITSRDQVIDLNAGQIPDIEGDEGIWWVMNDVGGPHLTTLSPPIGLEVQVLAFAFARADALGDATFYKYKFIYRGQQPLENAFLTIWSDPDLGNYLDDYIGSAPEIGLGFVYNADNDDETGSGYGAAPPALGYDFFLGPLVNDDGLDNDGDGETDEDDERLAMTRFGYYDNTADPRAGNPDTDQDYYNYMRGLWRDGTPWTEGGDAQNASGTPVNFVYPNSGSSSSPVPGYWSEVCPDPACSAPIAPNDRRFIMSTGPFTIEPGDVQEVVYGISWAQGSDNFGSLQAMKNADILAQRAFDLDFSLAPPPPAPDVQAVELGGEATLVWSYPETSSNYLASYDEPDPLISGLGGIEDSTYTFEGFNVYSYPNANFNDAERSLVATYDVINDVTTIIDTAFSAEIGGLAPFVAARGGDNGVQFYHVINEPLVSYTDYYYGVSAYAYNEESTPDVLESPATKITVRPANLEPGSVAGAETGSEVVGVRSAGSGVANVTVSVIDPTAVTGDTYELRVVEVTDEDTGETFLTYNIVNTTTGETVFSGEEAFTEQDVLVQPNEGRTIVADGLVFFVTTEPSLPEEDVDLVPDFAGDGRGIVEVANPDVEVCTGDAVDEGCEDYGGNTVWIDPNSTGEYLITGPGAAAGTGLGTSGLGRFLPAAAPDDYELRFTEACEPDGACLGFYGLGDNEIVSVPFELWNVGSAATDDPSDDVRMIPIILPEPTSGDPVLNWEDTFTSSQVLDLDGDGTPETTVPITHRVYWMMPDRPEGYEQFEAAANGFGGPGAVYDREADGDDQVDIDPSSGEPCDEQGAYIDFCFRSDQLTSPSSFVYPIGRMFVGDVAGDGTTPEPGVTVRFLVVPDPLFAAGDVFVFDTADLAFVEDDPNAAAAALELIGAVPNPYRGFSTYETGNLDRRIRFVNLPDEATIRIFTLSGTLVRTIRANNTRSIDWNLETEEGLPVASGMYLVHVETNIGDKVIKLGIVNRQTRFDAF
jgi:hypothetical protein